MFKNVLVSNPTLAIKSGGSTPTAQHSAFQYLSNGILKTKAAADLPALSGVIADDYKKVFFVYIDSSGTVTIDGSDTVALADDINIRELRNQQLALRDAGGLLVGWIVVINETGSDFTSGTTNLDASNVTVYYHNAFGLTKQDEVL